MHAITSRLRRSAVAVAAVGLIAVGALGAVGIAVAPAGAATQPTTQQVVTSLSRQMARLEKHFSCSNAQRRLTQAKRLEERFARGQARVEQRVATAQKAGHATQTAYWQKVLAHKERVEKRILNSRFLARAAAVSKVAESKCHVTMPAVVPLPALTPRTAKPSTSTTTTAPTTTAPTTTAPTTTAPTTTPSTTTAPTTTTPDAAAVPA